MNEAFSVLSVIVLADCEQLTSEILVKKQTQVENQVTLGTYSRAVPKYQRRARFRRLRRGTMAVTLSSTFGNAGQL